MSKLNFSDLINIDLNRANRFMQRKLYREALEPAGLSVQEWRAILNIYRHGPCHLRHLARASKLDATPLGKASVRLEKRGLVKSKPDREDARRKVLSVTDTGREKIMEIWPKATAISADLRTILGDVDYLAMQSALLRTQQFADPPSDG